VSVGFFELNPKTAELLAPPGSEAHLLLEPFPDDHLIVEIAYQSSVGPPPGAALAALFYQINRTCEKSSLTLALHGFASSQSAYDLSDLLSLEAQVRQHWPVWGTESLFYLYLNGVYAPEPSALGDAYRGSSIAIFERKIATVTDESVTPAEVTAAVMVHELGHELGLVGVDGYAVNEDPHHLGQSNDPTDVMYWGIDSSGSISNLSQPPPSGFTDTDLTDLRNVEADVIPYEVLPWAILAGAVVAAGVVVAVARSDRSVPEELARSADRHDLY
jgi:hypothetical protein